MPDSGDQMSIRHRLVGLIAAATIMVAACATTEPNGAPSPSTAQSTPHASETANSSVGDMAIEAAPADAPSASVSIVVDVPGFCVEVAATLTSSWPNLDPATAAKLGPAMNDWAMRPGFAALQEDLATVAMWLLASAGAAASPPADVQMAVDHLRAFADARC